MLKTQKHDKRPLRLTVVNPDDTAAVTFTRLAASKFPVVYYQSRLEDYVDWLSSWTSDE